MDTQDAAKKVADTAAKAEAKVDDVVEKVTQKVDEVIPEKVKVTAQDVAHTAEEVSKKVDEIVDKVDDFADGILPEQKGTDVDIDPWYEANISRLFIFRFLWIIIQYPILFVWGIIVTIVSIINFIYMLVTWKRHESMRHALVRFTRHTTKWSMYISWLIDKRPEIIEK